MLHRHLVALLLFTPISAIAGKRAEIPIRQVDLSDGARRYVVELQIDGKTVEAGLDTGSTGLRVLPRALNADAAAAHGDSVSYFYTSGTRFEGKAIRRTAAIGSATGAIRLMRIDSVGCTQAQQECPASRVDVAKFGIQGDGLAGEGFAAILGIGFKQDEVANPFEQLGIKRWIVELPRPGSGAPGKLILDPDASEIAGYKRMALVGDGNQVAGCLTGEPPRQSVCGLAVFDTGAPGIRIATAHRFAPWPQGAPAGIAVGDRANQATMRIEIGRRDQASAMFVVDKPEAHPPRISFGIAPYFHWSVLYDPAAHEIGVRDR